MPPLRLCQKVLKMILHMMKGLPRKAAPFVMIGCQLVAGWGLLQDVVHSVEDAPQEVDDVEADIQDVISGVNNELHAINDVLSIVNEELTALRDSGADGDDGLHGIDLYLGLLRSGRSAVICAADIALVVILMTMQWRKISSPS